MSRLGKKPIMIPEGVEIQIVGKEVSVTGPKGSLKRRFFDAIKIEKKENFIELSARQNDARTMALWGTCASHISNMIEGVTRGFSKTLLIEGVGYKVVMKDAGLVFSLGFSHPVEMAIPEGLEIKLEKNKIIISGIDKELVGQTAAQIRAFKKPEPYKGKGIRYENEIVRKKAGKKAVGSS